MLLQWCLPSVHGHYICCATSRRAGIVTPLALFYPRNVLVQSSRLERFAGVCFQRVEVCSNSKSSRLEMGVTRGEWRGGAGGSGSRPAPRLQIGRAHV